MELNDWKTIKLGDFVTLQRGHDLPTSTRIEGTTPVMGSAGISGYHNEVRAKGPGVTIGRSGVGSMGVVCYSPVDYWPLNTTLYVRDFHGNNPKFAYYFLKTINFRRLNSGSAQASLNRNHVHNLKIRVPSRLEQDRITSILSAFDDKIELNRQMNATLEEMARTLFKSWFVDFDPVRRNQEARLKSLASATVYDHLFPDELVVDENGREVPKGWEIQPLDKIADYQNGLALQKFPPEGDEYLPVIKIRELRQGFVDDNSNQASPNIKESCILYDGDVVFSWSGSLLVDLWCGGKGTLNQHLFKVTSEQYPKWFYFFWTKHHLEEFQRIAAGKATTMGHIQRSHLSAALANVPSKEVMEVGTAVIAPLIENIISNNLESQTLASLRDTLLPRLMSGQLRVPEARLLHKEVDTSQGQKPGFFTKEPS